MSLENEKRRYRGFIGLDLDGTVFDDNKHISEENKKAIVEAVEAGYMVAPVTGRPFRGLPAELMNIPDITYAVSSNGGAIYRVDSWDEKRYELVDEHPVSKAKVAEILDILTDFECIPDCFMNGGGHMELSKRETIKDLGMHPAILEYILSDRKFVDNLKSYVMSTDAQVEKITINFYVKDDLREKKRAYEVLKNVPDITLASGAIHNLEVNAPDVNKGTAVLNMAKLFDIPYEYTMACGDDQNDVDMIRMAAFGVAMANACEQSKSVADYITTGNNESGVAKAIYEFRRRIEQGVN